MNEKSVPTWVKVIAVIYVVLGWAAVGAVALLFYTMSFVFSGGLLTSFLIGLLLLTFCFAIFLIGRALYRGKNWARVTIIVLGSLSILNSAYVIFSKGTPENYLVFGSSAFMTFLIISYLTFNQKVIESFKNS